MDADLLLFDVPSVSPAHKSETQINNPFDQCEWIANHNTDDLEDPFDSVKQKINKFDLGDNNLLVNMNGSCESNNNNNLSSNLLNLSTDNSGNNSVLLTPQNIKMAHKFVKSGATPSPSSLKRDRVSADSGILKLTQSKMLLEKLRDSKSLDSDSLDAVTKKTQEILCPSFTQSDTSYDDLNSTTPKWVDLEQEDVSDIDTLTIPFLLSSSRGESSTQNGHGDVIGESHAKSELNKILKNIKKSNEKEEKQLFLNNLEMSIEEFMKRFNITKNCDKIKTVLKNLIDLLEGNELVEAKSVKIIRQETFELPKKAAEPTIKIAQQTSSTSKKTNRVSLNVSSRESISHRPAVTTPKIKVRASISHFASASKKENRSPSSINIARRSLYATPSKQVKSIAEVPCGRIRLRTKTHTLSTGGPLKAVEPIRASSIPPKITYTPSSSSNVTKPVISSSTPMPSKLLSTSRIATPSKTPIGKGISKIATPSRLSKLHTPSRVRTSLGDFNVS